MTLLPDPLEQRRAPAEPAGRHLVAVPDPAPRRFRLRLALLALFAAIVIAGNVVAYRDRAAHRETADRLRSATVAARSHEATMHAQVASLETQITATEVAIGKSIAARDASRRTLAALVKNEKGTNTQLTAVWAALERQQKELASLDTCLRSAHHALNTVTVWDPDRNLAVLDTSRLCGEAGR